MLGEVEIDDVYGIVGVSRLITCPSDLNCDLFPRTSTAFHRQPSRCHQDLIFIQPHCEHCHWLDECTARSDPFHGSPERHCPLWYVEWTVQGVHILALLLLNVILSDIRFCRHFWVRKWCTHVQYGVTRRVASMVTLTLTWNLMVWKRHSSVNCVTYFARQGWSLAIDFWSLEQDGARWPLRLVLIWDQLTKSNGWYW